MTRARVTAVVVVAAEVYLYTRYVDLDAHFHYWLHALVGSALGLGALSLTRLLRDRHRPADTPGPRRGLTPWEAAGLGHLYSAVPDVLFLTFGAVHDYWMDAFALHITIHFIPRPLLTMLAVFLLALLGCGLATTGRRRVAVATTLAAGLVLAAAVPLAAPVPNDIQDLRADPRLAYHHPPPPGQPAASPTEGHHQ